jgi:signal transduction histidine kinase
MNDFQEKHPEIAVELSLERDRQLLPEEVRLALFRVLQQAVSNVIRHSKAGEVRVRFLFDAEEAQLEVSDNGIGFEIPGDLSLLRAGWYGLGGEAERVRAQGGSLAVESKPGQGTTVRALVPWAQSGAWVPSIDVGEELHHVRYSRSNR